MTEPIAEVQGLEVIRRSVDKLSDSPLCYRLRTTATGTFTPQGLTTAGKVTEVTLNTATWTALPATALTDRNALGIINTSGVEIKLNYDSDVVGYVGVPVPDQGQRYYDVTDSITVYAKASSGTPTVIVDELA